MNKVWHTNISCNNECQLREEFSLLDFLWVSLSLVLLFEGDETVSTTDVWDAKDWITLQSLLERKLLPIKSFVTSLTKLLNFCWWLKLLMWEWDWKATIGWLYTPAAILWRLKTKNCIRQSHLMLANSYSRQGMHHECGDLFVHIIIKAYPQCLNQ